MNIFIRPALASTLPVVFRTITVIFFIDLLGLVKHCFPLPLLESLG